MSARIKSTTVAPLGSRAAFEKVVDDIATLQLEIDADVAVHNEAKARSEKAFKDTLKSKQERLLQKLASVEMFAAHHRTEILGDKQTAETKLALFGYRRSPGVLKLLNTRWTFGKAMQALKDAGKTACVKIREELDKQAVKRDIPEAELPTYGLRMDYPEEFWIEPKRAEQPAEKRISA